MKSLNSAFICQVLQEAQLITDQQAQYVREHEKDVLAQLKERSGQNGASDFCVVDTICAMNLTSGTDERMTISEELIMKTLAAHWKVPFLHIDFAKLTKELIPSYISQPFARKHLVVPVSVSKNMLFVAVTNPLNVEALDTIRSASKMKVRPVISTKSEIMKAIDLYYQARDNQKNTPKQLHDFQATVEAAESDLKKAPTMAKGAGLTSLNEDPQNEKNIVNAVNLMLHYACEQRASEIHLEAQQFYSQIRLRIDGLLYNVKRLPPEIHASMLQRFKALAGMDITEKRKPQDGRTQFSFHGRDITLRIAVMPMVFGEKLVIRLLDPILMLRHIEDLGLPPEEFARYLKLLSQTHGIILLAGPPSSGKTTTLYSTLDALSERGINITTLEDPIELPYDKFNQVALNPAVGFTYEVALRHIVRQSPDVIVIGEIRDRESMNNAIQSALLGHLVVSTLHSHDTASAILRLVKMGAEPFLLESSVIGVMAQRLLRRICTHCAQPYQLSLEETQTLQLGPTDVAQLHLLKGVGCLKCRGTGYLGQIGIFEILEISDTLRPLIHENAGAHTLKETALALGMRSLKDQAIDKMRAGLTTCEEVLRATGGLQTGTPQQFKTKIALS